MKKIIVVVAVIVCILSALKSGVITIPKESIRFRVIANSNTQYDQNIKREVIKNLESELRKIELVPKDILSTIFNEFKILTAPSAKFSALETEYKTGSSMTKSIPFFKAISVLVHLSKRATSPRCVKFPLITAIVKSALQAFLASSN